MRRRFPPRDILEIVGGRAASLAAGILGQYRRRSGTRSRIASRRHHVGPSPPDSASAVILLMISTPSARLGMPPPPVASRAALAQ